MVFQRRAHAVRRQQLQAGQALGQPRQQAGQGVGDHLVARLCDAHGVPGAFQQSLTRPEQFGAVDARAVTVDLDIGFVVPAQRPQGVGQGVVQLLLGDGLATRVEPGLADKGRGDGFHQFFLHLQQAGARQGQGALQFHLAVPLRQLGDHRLVELDFQVEQAAGPAVQATQGHTAVHQADGAERTLLDDTQQQGQLVPLHAAGHRQQHFTGLATLPVQLLQLGVNQVPGMPGGPQCGLQGFGAQLPPVARVDVPRLQAGRGAGWIAEAVLPVHQQGVTRALQVCAAVPQLQVAVIDVQQGDRHVVGLMLWTLFNRLSLIGFFAPGPWPPLLSLVPLQCTTKKRSRRLSA